MLPFLRTRDFGTAVAAGADTLDKAVQESASDESSSLTGFGGGGKAWRGNKGDNEKDWHWNDHAFFWAYPLGLLGLFVVVYLTLFRPNKATTPRTQSRMSSSQLVRN
jgi:hypothetical protein